MLDIACRSEILEAIAHAQSVSAVLDALMSEHVDSDTGPHVQVVEWFKEKQDEVAALTRSGRERGQRSSRSQGTFQLAVGCGVPCNSKNKASPEDGSRAVSRWDNSGLLALT